MPNFPELKEEFLNGIRQMISENSFISKSVFFKGFVKILEGFSEEISEDHVSFGSENMMNLLNSVSEGISYSMSLTEDISELKLEDITLD